MQSPRRSARSPPSCHHPRPPRARSSRRDAPARRRAATGPIGRPCRARTTEQQRRKQARGALTLVALLDDRIPNRFRHADYDVM